MPSSARDTVFISYSHKNAVWLERIVTFLKPFTRNQKLTVWADPYIKVGDVWRREIDAALERSAVGVLLVSPDFIASDFIYEVELPALIGAADAGNLTLICVPISACIHEETRLSEFQWARSPDLPLDQLTESKRNPQLVRIAKAVLEAVARGSPPATPATTAPVSATPRAAAPIRPGPRGGLGTLHDVPMLPLHYLPRADDLSHLRRSLLEGESWAMGLTGEPHRVGLHGQGGIGKSVLATALARDEQVRLAFPDGVFWVTVGQSPDVLWLQSELLMEAGEEFTSVSDVERGRKLLNNCLGGRTILLVLDDVWEYGHARAFDVLDPASRLLVTTRDGALLTALGAHSETVQRLPEAAALSLLASWAGWRGGPLPTAAHEIALECGYLPLALSVAGARVRDGTTWEVVLKALQQGRLEFLDHPYGSVFGSMRLSVDALPSDERQRYLELAVFPEDERVPEPVVLTLWKQTGGLDELSGQALIARFHSKALLEVQDKDGRREVALHDLQHDFLRISLTSLPALNEELLAALAGNLPVTDEGTTTWWGLPSEELYAWIHLAKHLVAADRTAELCDLLFDFRWLEAKLRATGLQAMLADFTACPGDEELSLVAGALRLSGHVLGRDANQLRSQLTGRLLGIDRPRIHRMLCRVEAAGAGPWLRPLFSSLTSPIGPLLRTLAGHTEAVNAVTVTADGRRVISGSNDGTLKVWDCETGAEERTLTGHIGAINTVVVTADGRRVISGSDDKTLKVWDVATGAEERTLTGHANGVSAVAVTADGGRVISGSHDGTLKVWDMEAGVEIHTFAGHANWVTAIAVTVNGRGIFSSSRDGTVKMWDVEAGVERCLLTCRMEAVRVLAVTADGRHVISGGDEDALRIWDVETGEEVRTLDLENWPYAVAVTADGRRVISGYAEGLLKIWDLKSGTAERTLTGHSAMVKAVVVTTDGRRVISGSGDGTMKVWDVETGAQEHAFAGHSTHVQVVMATADGRHVVSGSDDGTVKVWDVATGTEERTLALLGGFTHVAVTADGRRVISASHDRRLTVWSVETGAEERTLTDQSGWVTAVAVTADGRWVISGYDDGTLKVWNLETGAEERTLTGPSSRVPSVAVAADSRRVICGFEDGTIKVWDVTTGEEERTLVCHGAHVMTVAAAANGRHVISGYKDGTVKVWDVATGAEDRTLIGHEDRVRAVAVTADGLRVISGSDDGTLKVWDVSSGCACATFTAEWPVVSCAATVDGGLVFGGDRVGRVHFLSLEGLQPE